MFIVLRVFGFWVGGIFSFIGLGYKVKKKNIIVLKILLKLYFLCFFAYIFKVVYYIYFIFFMIYYYYGLVDKEFSL